MSSSIFLIIFAIFYVAVIVIIITVAVSIGKARRRSRDVARAAQASPEYTRAYNQLTGRNSTGRVSAATMSRNEKISDAKVKKIQKDLELGRSTPERKTFAGRERRNDRTVTGYDRNFVSSRSESARQYSHTYDGHEPWDDCLPKEKDPWDKDFYAGRK